MYETMVAELEKLLDCNEAVEAEDVITQLSADLGVMLKGRLKSMDVYDKLNQSSKLTVYSELQVVLRYKLTVYSELQVVLRYKYIICLL